MSAQVACSDGTSAAVFDVHSVRARFPGLHQQVNGHPLVYLDNAATTQKPQVVLDALSRYYSEDNANIHRGVHTLSQRATAAYDRARSTVRRFLNARHDHEIVYVRGTTEAINLVASSYGGMTLRPGDEVLITTMEHHSNIVPWQLVCERTGARLRVAPMADSGELEMDAFVQALSPRTRIVSVVHVSNALGTVNPVEEIVRMAHGVGARVLVDGAQAAVHLPVDVQALDCDFYAFSGHKVFGPTGIGALYGKAELLEAMPPYQGGGDMIETVSFERTTYAAPPARFEAGTPHIAGAIGLSAALEFLGGLDRGAVLAHEADLLAYSAGLMGSVPGLRLVGVAREKASVVSFLMDAAHPHDIGTILDHYGVAIRTGHHCAMPLMNRLGVPATARASFALYNTRDDADALVAALHRVREVMA